MHPFEIKIGNNKNCYEKCEYYYYVDEENNYHCTEGLSCPKDYPTLLAEKNWM